MSDVTGMSGGDLQFAKLDRPLAKKIYVRLARAYMHRQGFGHDWIENYARRLADEIDAAADRAELAAIRERVQLLQNSPPPIAWAGA